MRLIGFSNPKTCNRHVLYNPYSCTNQVLHSLQHQCTLRGIVQVRCRVILCERQYLQQIAEILVRQKILEYVTIVEAARSPAKTKCLRHAFVDLCVNDMNPCDLPQRHGDNNMSPQRTWNDLYYSIRESVMLVVCTALYCAANTTGNRRLCEHRLWILVMKAVATLCAQGQQVQKHDAQHPR